MLSPDSETFQVLRSQISSAALNTQGLTGSFAACRCAEDDNLADTSWHCG